MSLQIGGSANAVLGHLRKAFPVIETPSRAEFEFGGIAGERIEANLNNWLLPAPTANPAMLEMFRDRDRTPDRDLVPWAGEFAGKYLISAVQALRITQNAGLRAHMQGFVAELVGCQDEDGYLGPFPRERRIFGPNLYDPQWNSDGVWDLWGHYHCMLGLYLWHIETHDDAAFRCCLRAADYICGLFLDGSKRVAETLAEEMNESSIHIFTLLHQATGEPRYLDMARHIEEDWQKPPSGDYLRFALAEKAFYECPKPRWESLPSIQAMGELYYISGDERYKKAMENLWWSMVEFDRHNTGGFTSGEKATGNPYDKGAIETCCTVAWMALTIDMLRLTGDSRAADELELSTYNATFGAQHPSGRWWTYDTPMDGERKSSTHGITFQARAGSPELNCCSVNGPRSLGMLSEWSVMLASNGLTVNYYGPSEFTVELDSGCQVNLAQRINYPLDGRVELTVSPDVETSFSLHLRIPSWSQDTSVSINGQATDGVEPGTYTTIERCWKQGDRVELVFDMSPMLWVGERECEGKMSIYRGPILLAYDPRYDVYDPTALPTLDLSREPVVLEAREHSPRPMLLVRFATEDGKGITLCDFASAGAAGHNYVSWLTASGFSPEPFSRANPLRRTQINHFGGGSK